MLGYLTDWNSWWLDFWNDNPEWFYAAAFIIVITWLCQTKRRKSR